MNLLRW